MVLVLPSPTGALIRPAIMRNLRNCYSIPLLTLLSFYVWCSLSHYGCSKYEIEYEQERAVNLLFVFSNLLLSDSQRFVRTNWDFGLL